MRAPVGRSTMKLPVARSTIHILPLKAATTFASSGEMVAKPWPPVFRTLVTSGSGGGTWVTAHTQRLFVRADSVGATRYLPSRETTWHATHLIWSSSYIVPTGLPTT